MHWSAIKAEFLCPKIYVEKCVKSVYVMKI